MRLLVFGIAGCLVGLAIVSQANMMLVPPPAGAPSYTGPGDVVATATAFWGLRAYNATKATATAQAVNIVRASDSHACDVLLASTGDLGLTANCGTGGDNGATATAFCNATTCAVATFYDQTGNGWNLVQATGANRPAFSVAADGALPLMHCNGSQWVAKTTAPAFAQPWTVATVTERTPGSSVQMSTFANSNGVVIIGWLDATNTADLHAGADLTATMSDAALHSFIAVGNGAVNSKVVVDGTATTGNGGTSPFSSGDMDICSYFNGATYNQVGYVAEVGIWPIGFTPTQYGNVCHNQFAYWATAASC